jgi:5'/3'-nucleotidase SurE
LYAAISKVPSVAFSKHLINTKSQDAIKKEMENIFPGVVKLLARIKSKPFPHGIELLNINFPKTINEDTPIKVVKADRKVFQDIVQERVDPVNRPYYWLYGTLKKDFDPTADVANLLNGNITITPIKLYASDKMELSSVREMFV